MPKGIYFRSEEHKKRLSQMYKGKKRPPFSEEWKRKMSIAHKGKPSKRGADNPCWKGGRNKDSDGYIRLYKPNHPLCNQQGYIKEHRLVMEKHLGRLLSKEECIHHINGNIIDNNIKNLQLFPNVSKHSKHHFPHGRYSLAKEIS